MATNYDGLTRNPWPGTWSPDGEHPIALDRELRGSLQYVSGDVGDRLTNISGQRLQEGMMVYLKTSYSDGIYAFIGDRYYQYRLGFGESRNPTTGAMPNASTNWYIMSLSANTASAGANVASNAEFLTVANFRIQPLAGPNTEFITSIINIIDETANNTTLATSLAIKTYVDETVKVANITSGFISNVAISNLVSPIATTDGGTGLTEFTENGVFYAANTITIRFASGLPGELLQIAANSTPYFSMIDGGLF